MTEEPEGPGTGAAATGLVLFAYDGTDLASEAIEQAGRQLATDRDALVACVWQPVDVGFTPTGGCHFDADNASEVCAAAEATAAHGASLAEKAGFRARRIAVEAAPTWKGIVDTATRSRAGLIVIGSHRHPGLIGHLVGHVASAVIAHASSAVLVVPGRS